MLEVESML